MYREIQHYSDALRTYITSTYHISNPALVDLRDELLLRTGAIAQEPFLESTARYAAIHQYADLNLPSEVSKLLTWLGEQGIVFNPPYDHQAQALELSLNPTFRDLVVTTGTGSGKTETFLLPILGRLASEAVENRSRFEVRALRALLLYPMNALVNDQLGRLRVLFGADLLARWFTDRTGRPVKFARYTGRTLYPGRRCADTNRHRERLQSLIFYCGLESRAVLDPATRALIAELRARGKWPAKPSRELDHEDGVSSWYGQGRWKDVNGNWIRTVERPEDPELFTRHEVQEGVPDLLVTNYSMLEYMLLRPIERGIFQSTADYYRDNPSERLLLVLDEAHLYRGAQGTEVAMLIRRLRNRLGLPLEQLQVICTSASFSNPNAAREFAAELVGKHSSGFEILAGTKMAAEPSGSGDQKFAEALASIDFTALRASNLDERISAVMPVLLVGIDRISAPRMCVVSGSSIPQDVVLHCLTKKLERIECNLSVATEMVELPDDIAAVLSATALSVKLEVRSGKATELTIENGNTKLALGHDPIARLLYSVLRGVPVVGRLINLTSGAQSQDDDEMDPQGIGSAQHLGRLGERLFPDLEPELARSATDALVELASIARIGPSVPPLLAARVHTFFRGLPGLWACSNPNCTQVSQEQREKWKESNIALPTGALYDQPVHACKCGSRVFEIYTCRSCGTAFFKAFAFKPNDPDYLWTEDVGEVDGVDGVVQPIFILLEEPPSGSGARFEYLDPVSGRIGSTADAVREVWLPPLDQQNTPLGEFGHCPCCAANGSDIMDHVTKGDEPFQEIVSSQLLEQPPRPDVQTPLRGRKALIFSDGRQAASRLAGKLQQYSLRDAVRPLILDGIAELERRFQIPITLDHSYAALLTGCVCRGVHLRPVQAPHFDEDLATFRELLNSDPPTSELVILSRSGELNTLRTNKALMLALYPVLKDPYTGLSALALATIKPSLDTLDLHEFELLPAPPVPAELSEAERRQALLELWVSRSVASHALMLPTTPNDWLDAIDGARITRTRASFPDFTRALVGAKWFAANLNGAESQWSRFIKKTFAVNETANGFILRASKLRVVTTDLSWRRCEICTTAQIANPLAGDRCVVRLGNRQCSGTTRPLDPSSDPVFSYRSLNFTPSSLNCG